MKNPCLVSSFYFLLLASAFAQVELKKHSIGSLDLRSAAAAFSPTNIAGFPAISWWVFGDMTTNAGQGIVADRWTNHYDLTNTAGTAVPALNPTGLNGLGTVTFDGVDDYLRSISYTSAQPHEIFAVLRFNTNGAISSRIIVNHAGAALAAAVIATFDDSLDIRAPTTSLGSGQPLPQGKWMILDLQWRGGSSAILTNNVLYNSPSTGGNGMDGIVFAARATLDVYYKFSVAEIVTFGGSGGVIPGTNTVAQSNLFNYFSAKYGIP